jgi:hypothetical protein
MPGVAVHRPSSGSSLEAPDPMSINVVMLIFAQFSLAAFAFFLFHKKVKEMGVSVCGLWG